MKTSIPRISKVTPKGNLRIYPVRHTTEVEDWLLKQARDIVDCGDLESFVLVGFKKNLVNSVSYFCSDNLRPELLPSLVEENIRAKIYGIF